MKADKPIIIVVRHFFPFTAPSGVTSLVREIILEMDRRKRKVIVVCLRKEGEEKEYEFNGIKIYKFSQKNLLHYFSIMRSLNGNVLFISSMNKVWAILLWWWPLYVLTIRKRISFYQATNFTSFSTSFFLKIFLNRFQNVFSGSDDIYSKLKSSKVKSIKVYSGVDFRKVSSFAPRDVVSLRRDNIQVGFFGHLTYVKGIDLFVNLAKSFPEITFKVVAGKREKDYPQFTANILESIKQTKNVTYKGFIPNPLEEMAKCYLLVLPYREGGTVLGVAQSAIEAMAMGIPVIGTVNTALTPLIVDGENGYLCQSIGEMKEKIESLLSNDELYKKMSINAKITVKEKFSIKQSVNLLEKNL